MKIPSRPRPNSKALPALLKRKKERKRLVSIWERKELEKVLTEACRKIKKHAEEKMGKTKKAKKIVAKKATKKKPVSMLKIADLHYPTVIIRLNDKVLKELGLDAKNHTRKDATTAILERAGLDKL